VTRDRRSSQTTTMSGDRGAYLPLLDAPTFGGAKDSSALASLEHPPLRQDDEENEEPLTVPAAFIERELLLEVMKKRIYRARQCRSVPISVITFFFYIVCLLTHISIPTGYDVEWSLVTTLVTGPGFALTTPLSFYSWLSSNLVPVAFGGGGYLDQYNLAIGGVRLVTTRSNPSTCPGLPGSLSQLYAQSCYPESGSLSTYSNQPFGNATAAAEFGVLSAFQPVLAQDGSGVPEFQFFIDTMSTPQQATNYVNGLSAAGWIDASTRECRVQMTFLNGEVAAYARVEWVADFTRGSLVTTSYNVLSVPVAPYEPWSSRWYLLVFDFLLFAYWFYLLWGTIRRILKAIHATGPESGFWDKFLACATSYWRILDVTTTVLLFAVFVSWISLCSKLQSIQHSIDSATVVSPAAFSSGPSDLQYQVLEAGNRLSNFKVLGSLTLAAMLFRLGKYVAFQPRLNVLGETFSRACSDLAHHSFLYCFILLTFTLVAHVLFGTQAPDWSGLLTSILSSFRYSQYDVDLHAMTQQYPFWASVHYVLFMVLITNLFLWMLLGVILDHFSEVRYASHLGPSAWEELIAYLGTLPQNCGLKKLGRESKRLKARSCFDRLVGFLCCRCGSRAKGPTSGIRYPSSSNSPNRLHYGAISSSAQKGRDVPSDFADDTGKTLPVASPHISVSDLPSLVSWSDVVRVLKRHPTLSAPGAIIRPFPLAKALNISPEVANLLIADAVVTHRVLAGLPLSEVEENAGLWENANVAGGPLSPGASGAVDAAEHNSYQHDGSGASSVSGAAYPQKGSPILPTVASAHDGFNGHVVDASPLLGPGNTGSTSSPPFVAVAGVHASPAVTALAIPPGSVAPGSSSSSTAGGAGNTAASTGTAASGAVDTARVSRALYGALKSKDFPNISAATHGAGIRTARSNSSGSAASPSLAPVVTSAVTSSTSTGAASLAWPVGHPPGLVLPSSAAASSENDNVSVLLSLAPHPVATAAPISIPPASPTSSSASATASVPVPFAQRTAIIQPHVPDKSSLPALPEEPQAGAGSMPSSSFHAPSLSATALLGAREATVAPSEEATATAELVLSGYGGGMGSGTTVVGTGGALVPAGGMTGLFGGRAAAMRLASNRLQLIQRQAQQEEEEDAAQEAREREKDKTISDLKESVDSLRSQMANLVQLMLASQQQAKEAGKDE
jgi:Polycystin cation channel